MGSSGRQDSQSVWQSGDDRVILVIMIKRDRSSGGGRGVQLSSHNCLKKPKSVKQHKGRGWGKVKKKMLTISVREYLRESVRGIKL